MRRVASVQLTTATVANFPLAGRAMSRGKKSTLAALPHTPTLSYMLQLTFAGDTPGVRTGTYPRSGRSG
jgi:hypothetical protein